MENQYSNHKKWWTKQEDELLLSLVGTKSFDQIAKQLGRTPKSIEKRLTRLGEGSTILASGMWTTPEIGNMMGVTYQTVIRWITEFGLPATRQNLRYTTPVKKKNSYYRIRVRGFWRWAKKNKDKLDFSKIPEASTYLDVFPEWAREERKQQLIQRNNATPKRGTRWTKEEDEFLLFALKGKQTLKEIGEHLQRTESSVKQRKNRLKVQGRITDRKKVVAPKLNQLEKRVFAEYGQPLHEVLEDWYWNKGDYIPQIAEKLEESSSYIRSLFVRYEIPTKPKSTHNKKHLYTITIAGTDYKVRGRYITSKGNAMLRVPSHPYVGKDGYISEKRIRLEQHLDRIIEPSQVHYYMKNYSHVLEKRTLLLS